MSWRGEQEETVNVRLTKDVYDSHDGVIHSRHALLMWITITPSTDTSGYFLAGTGQQDTGTAVL